LGLAGFGRAGRLQLGSTTAATAGTEHQREDGAGNERSSRAHRDQGIERTLGVPDGLLRRRYPRARR
jgi:hypothetical protein